VHEGQAGIIAVRDLLYTDDDGGQIPVQIRIRRPVRNKFGVACTFEVCGPDGDLIALRALDGSSSEVAATVWAKDDVGAIQSAIEAVRISLKPVGNRLAFEGMRGTGLSMTITAFSYTMERHLEQLVEDETASIRLRLEDPTTRGEALRQIRDDEP
jgi:hypothetical protein